MQSARGMRSNFLFHTRYRRGISRRWHAQVPLHLVSGVREMKQMSGTIVHDIPFTRTHFPSAVRGRVESNMHSKSKKEVVLCICI